MDKHGPQIDDSYILLYLLHEMIKTSHYVFQLWRAQCCIAMLNMIDYSVFFLISLPGLAAVSQVDRLRPRPSAGEWPKS